MRPLSSCRPPRIPGQHPDRVLRAAAKDAGMQVAVGGLDPDLVVDQPAQRGGDRRRVGIPHAGVADQREVGLRGPALFASRNGTKFFDPTSSSPSMTMVTSTGSEPVTDFQARQASTKVISWPLSSCGAARDDDLAPVGMVGHDRLERRAMPEIERIDRLHVVVTVEQHMRPPACRHWPWRRWRDDRRSA